MKFKLLSRLRKSEEDEPSRNPNFGTELPPIKNLNHLDGESSSDDSAQNIFPSIPENENETSSSTFANLATCQNRPQHHRLLRKKSVDESDAILQVVIDRIEDEVEENVYDHLVPLDVKLALEDKVFGWTHLTSSIIGHILFTGGSYWLTFQGVSFVCVYVFGVDPLEAWVIWVRAFLSLWAAVTTFRMVRRRRHIWFRSAYGSKSYYEDAERRRQEVAETDRTTALGRFVQSFKHRRVLSKLRKAETQFAKKHKRHHKELLKHRTANSLESDAFTDLTSVMSERQSLLSRQKSDDEDDMSYGSAASSSEASIQPEEVSCERSNLSPGPSIPLTKAHRRPSFNTKPTARLQSYAHDEILMEECINLMPYSHGGFFGAAPFMLSNPHWISLLRHLMPDVYVEISRRVAINPPSRLIHWAENNPVVAAYGAAHALDQGTLENSNNPPGFTNLEWDVFLDPTLVRRVQIVLDQHADFLRQKPMSDRSEEQLEGIEAYYTQELRQRSQQLVDEMLIAHGNALQLGIEQMGFWKEFNYSRVKRTRRTLGGGIYARQWMAVFAEALKLGVCHEDENGDVPSPSKPALGGTKKKVSSLLSLAASTCPDTNIEESIKLLRRVTRSDKPVGLVLDIKSRHVPHHIWAIVVDTLRNAGVRVEGVASFCIDEIRDLSRFSTIAPIPGMIFCHSAGDIQKLCHDGKIRKGDQVFFNAGCLLQSTLPSSWSELIASFDPRKVKESYKIESFGLPRNQRIGQQSCLQDYKDKFDIHIGTYCQEFAVDEAAVQTLVKLINRNPALYDLGFSWGGINGITIKGIAPGRFTKTDGYWNQRYIGMPWNYDLHPEEIPSVAALETVTETETETLSSPIPEQ